MYEASEEFGYRLVPSKTTELRYPENSPHAYAVVSNSDGFRGHRELSETEPRRRILVSGDSFVFGLGVAESERLTEVLEAMEPAWRVDNAGMVGFGVDLMIRSLEHILPREHPDVVVLAVYTDDFRRMRPYYAGIGFPIPKFELVGSTLVTRPFAYPSSFARLRIVQALYDIYWTRLRNRNRYDLHDALLARYLTLAKQFAFRPFIAFLPGKLDTSEDRARRGYLRKWSATHGVGYLDLTGPIYQAGVATTYIQNNWHWNATGHRVAARALHDFLIKQGVGVDSRYALPGDKHGESRLTTREPLRKPSP